MKNHTSYFAALMDGLKDYLPPDLHFEEDGLVREAKKLIGDDKRKFRLGKVNSIMPTIAKKGASTKRLAAVAIDGMDDVFSEKDSENINQLLVKFQQTVKEVKLSDNPRQSDYTLHHILHKYTARIGCYELRPETTLFDRNRILAAVTACLECLEGQPRKFYLVKGDLSGIQRFITSGITLENPGEGAHTAKRLRGRSFLIALLTNFLAEHIIDELNLFQSNIIFAGGGHFNLLLPATAEIDAELKNLEQKLNEMLFDEVGMTTSLVLAKTEIDGANGDAPFAKVSDYYVKLNPEMEKQKSKRYKGYLSEMMRTPIKPKKYDSIGKEMGENIPRADYLVQINVNDIEDVHAMKNEKGVVFYLEKTQTVFAAFKDDFKGGISELLDKHESCINSLRITKLNDTNFLEYQGVFSQNMPISHGFTFVGKHAPLNHEGVLSFDKLAELCHNPKDSFEFAQLAVMRLDIDNLGAIFIRGLAEKGQPSSFQRLATLSREFHWFFSGYFNTLAEQYQIYVTYSGGDDAFVVGSWYNVLHFAVELRQQFEKFVCGNKKIHFSAGIFMCHPHYPVGRFAEDAADCEKFAKQFNGRKKNGIHVFDHTLGWKGFISKMEFAEKLLGYISKDGDNTKDPEKLARSLIHRLLRILRSCMKDGEVRIDNKRLTANIARLHYLFARHGFNDERIKTTTQGLAKDIIKVILDDFNNQDQLEDYLIPFNYVIMKTRKMK